MINNHPNKFYTIREKLENSRFGVIHLMERKDNKQLLVLKHIDQNSAEDRDAAINECSLMKLIDSPYVLGCEEIYDYEGQIWFFL